MFLNQLLDAWRSSSRALQRRRAKVSVTNTGTEPLEVRQLLTAVSESLFDPTLTNSFGANDLFPEHVAIFSVAKDATALKVATGATSVTPAQFLTNGYTFTFSSPKSLVDAGTTFSRLADFESFTPVFAQQRTKRFTPNDPLYVDQWHLNNTGQGNGTVGLDVNVDGVWDNYRGSGVVIGVVDDGVQLTHEDLVANALPALSFDWNGNDNDPSPNVTQDFHGTAVAGVAAGVGNNGLGISGAAPEAGIAGLRLIAAPNTDLDEAQALTWQSNQIDIYNNSWGPADNGRIAGIGPQAQAALRQGFQTGRNGLGSIYVWAGGNGGNRQDNVNYDAYANSRYTIAIGALDQNGVRASYSEPGAPLIVTAYSQGSGIAITTSDLVGDDGYNAAGNNDGDNLGNVNYTSTFNGTSSAAPLAAGVIALMLDANPGLTSREVQDILVHTARRTDLNNADWRQNGAGLWVNHNYGFGAIDAGAAVSAALSYIPLGPEISATTGLRTVATAIPDGSGVARSSVAVTNVVSLEYVEVYLSATHTNRGQLNVTLISPSGTRSVLAETRTVDDNAAADPGYSRWRFTSARHWDELSAGTWTIEVSDPVSGETGTFDSYEIVFYGTDPDIPVPSKPQVLAPIGAIAIVAPTYSWTTSTNAASYELEVRNKKGNIVLAQAGLIQTQFQQPGQLAQDTYSIRVRAVNTENEFSEWSDITSFTIDIPSPAVPQMTRPIGDITDSFPSFVWTGDDVTTSYSLWVNDITTPDAAVRVIYRTAYSDTSYVHFAPLKDGTYRAWVRAFNAIGEFSGWSNAVTFTVDSPVPGVPKVTGPVALSTNETPRITWTASDGAARYDLWINNLTTGAAQYIRKTNISYTTPYFDTPSLPQGSYKVWVRAANGNEELSNWSDPYTFTVDIQRPGVPSITGPVGAVVDQTITTSNPTFTWTAAARAVKYDLWVNNLTTGQAQIIRQQNINGLSYVALNNLPQGDYRAWVRGINSADEVGEWSTVFIFNLDEPTPSLPTIVEPKSNPAGSVENPNPTFVWTSDFNAPFYEFRLDDTTLNKTNVINVTNIQSKMYTIPNDKRLAEHIYNAYVRGINNAGEKSDWSPAFRVRIDVPNPTTPTIIAPKLTSKDTTPTFEWKLDTGSFRYEILVRDLERDETIVLQVKSYLINQTDPTNKFAYYTLPDNQAFKTGTYRFWIRAFNSIGTASSWSTAQTFVISASLDLKDLKIVEPARLQSAEQFYADAVFYAEPVVESPNSMKSDAGDANPETMELASVIVPEHVDDMSAAMIENVMESLADPASETSAMFSGVTFANDATSSSSGNTTTAVASILALAMIPKRRKRREE